MKHDDLSGMSVSRPETGPLGSGCYRVVGRSWGVDYDAKGRSIGVCKWPPGLSQQDYLLRAKRAVERLRPSVD